MGRAAQVVVLVRVAFEFELQVAELLLQAKEAYVLGAVRLGAAALLYLF